MGYKKMANVAFHIGLDAIRQLLLFAFVPVGIPAAAL